MKGDAASLDYTIFEYMYRDAANYKAFGSILLSGSISNQERQFIQNACDSGLYFIAEQIGIPALYAELYQYSGGPTEDDHVFHELLGLREHNPTPGQHVWGSSPELIRRFTQARGCWNLTLSPHWHASFWS